MSTRVIQKLAKYRGFGFSKSDDGQAIFFHRSDVKGVSFDLLKERQSVKFMIRLGRKGLQAHSVELINKGVKMFWKKRQMVVAPSEVSHKATAPTEESMTAELGEEKGVVSADYSTCSNQNHRSETV